MNKKKPIEFITGTHRVRISDIICDVEYEIDGNEILMTHVEGFYDTGEAVESHTMSGYLRDYDFFRIIEEDIRKKEME